MQTKLVAGYTSRPPTTADAEAINELICAVDVADYGEPDYSVDDLFAEWRRAGFQLERDAWMVFAPDGTFVAYGNVYDAGEHVRVDPTTCIHPEYREQGLEDYLIARAADWTCQYSQSKTVQWIVNVEHMGWTERFRRRGYYQPRHDYVMELDLSAPPPAPVLLAGFTMRSFERGLDDRQAWICLNEAFRDHRGHVDLEYEEWAKLFFDHPNWSAELSPVIHVNDQMVAAGMVFDYPNGGWVRTLGVRRTARKKGLGLALLYQIFQWCYARGKLRVGLGVDAESLTGATRLYERAGMHIKTHFVRFEKTVP